jgi:hypothetical protein
MPCEKMAKPNPAMIEKSIARNLRIAFPESAEAAPAM